MPKVKTIRFTAAELNMIQSMCGIAWTNCWGEGDYCGHDWESEDAENILNNLFAKASELLRRSKRRTENERREAWNLHGQTIADAKQKREREA